MLFHKYLEETIGNKPALSMLRAMIRRRGMVFTVRRLAEEAKISINECSLTTQYLERIGIINIQPIGKAYHLTLNEKSYILNQILRPIFEAEKNTMQQLIQMLKKYLTNKKTVSAVLFGSVTKGEERLDSDIDLLIISNDIDSAIDSVSKASSKVFEVFHGKISHIVFSEKQFKTKRNGDLMKSILSNHMLICGKELSDIK
jgi:predicted nucleotidyltransferase